MKAREIFERFAADPEFLSEWERLKTSHSLALNEITARRRLGLSQQALASSAGIRQPRIAEIERGDANPRLDTLDRIAAALQTTVADLTRIVPSPLFEEDRRERTGGRSVANG
jgi:transcriptional regulator with XRE-family HTH domain